MMHHICLILLEGRLHMAPVGSAPQKILDIGTGTGIWAIDVAKYIPITLGLEFFSSPCF